MIITLNSGERLDLNIGGHGLVKKQKPASFELTLCPRDHQGNKTGPAKHVYRGSNPAAVEACFLKGLSEVEKKVDVYIAKEVV